MRYDDNEDDIFDEDDYEDFDDDIDDEDSDDEIMPDNDEDEDVFDVLEYNDTCQIQSRQEIIGDIRSYLKQYQPMFKVVRRKDM